MIDPGARESLLAEIEAEFRATAATTGRGAPSPRLRAALARVPREVFVPEAYAPAAYDNRPLPIGGGQTISQPFIVALMTELLDLTPASRVLEIGTGSGYQAAILAELAPEVFTVERIEPLSVRAEATLAALGYRNIRFRIGDGSQGWAEHAPYDAIIVTAAAPEVPVALKDQLAVGGRLLLPVGRPYLPPGRGGEPAPGAFRLRRPWPDSGIGQRLVLITRQARKRFTEIPVLDVAFVPLIAAAEES